MATIGKPILVRPEPLVALAAGNAIGGHPPAHLGRFKAPGLIWASDGPSDLWLRGQFAGAKRIDFCALIAANARPGTTIRLRLGSSPAAVDGENAPFDSGALPFIDPAIVRADGRYHSHLKLDEAVEASWWRIDIAGHAGDFEASALVMGEAIQPARFYNSDFEFGTIDLGDVEIGRFGVLDETPGALWRRLDFTLGWVSEAEFEAKFRPLQEAIGAREVIYCCFDSEPGPYRQARTYMGVLGRPLFARGTRMPRNFEQEFSIQSYI